MQLVKQPSRPPKPEGKLQLSDLLSLDMTPDEERDSTLDYIFHLQAEVKALRHELAEARRALGMKETLLKNYLRREQALRAELIDGQY
jgi:hypothetical protein